MRISAKQIKEAAQCFRRFRFLSQEEYLEREDQEIKIIKEVLRRSYAHALSTGYKPNWRGILGWVDKRVFEHVNIDDEQSFQAGKSTSETILSFLNRWYKDVLLPENVLAYPNITLSQQISNAVIYTELPIVKLQEKATILNVNKIVCTDPQLYNDMEARIHAWLLDKALECGDVVYQKMTMGPRGGFNQNLVNMTREAHKRTEKAVFQIVRAISQRANFPSVSEQCAGCQFRRRCKL